MAKYSLVGVDGNAYSVMGYTARALRREGLGDLAEKMFAEATSGDYWHLVAVCCEYVEKANEVAGECDEEDDYDL